MATGEDYWRRQKLDGTRSGDDRRDEVVEEDIEIATMTQKTEAQAKETTDHIRVGTQEMENSYCLD
jgi:hypothetical protein